MKTLQNKTIVITGASSGIGEKVALKVAKKGAQPILLARSEDKLKELTRKIKTESSVACIYFPLDVSDTDQVIEVFGKIDEEVGDIDILLNNAGFGVFDAFNGARMEDIERMFDISSI